MSVPVALPPQTLTADGRPRKVGIEIEFGRIGAREAAVLVRDLFGGTIEELDPHRFRIDGTRFGAFKCELDTQYAHLQVDPDRDLDLLPAELRQPVANLVGKAGAAIGEIARYWMPSEVMTPPLPFEAIAEADRLVAQLRTAGAEGTRAAAIYAFGVQLNPEVPATDAGSLLRHLQAYVLCSDWLRREIDIDATRRLLPFVDRFPRRYVRLILDRNYRPDRDRLIADYLQHNPTRNRELDMLPLFKQLDPERVTAALPGVKINPRPAFHYRLPNAALEDPDWSIVTEWNRWVKVETLAADGFRLRAMADAFLANDESWSPADWGEQASAWLEP